MAGEEKIKVLIVDDEESIRFFLNLLLTRQGLSVVMAEDGYKAIELAQKDKFALVFLDLRMPGMNGVETLKAIKKISPATVFVMMSGYAVDDLMREAQREGAVLMLEKPFELTVLTTFLKDYIANRSSNSPAINILVVDDDKNELDFFKKSLAGHTVVTLETAAGALEAIGKQHFDLAFIDMMLTDMDGAKLSSKILKISPKTKVVFITGYYEKYKDELEKLTIECYLTKPITEEVVFSVIEKIKKAPQPPQQS